MFEPFYNGALLAYKQVGLDGAPVSARVCVFVCVCCVWMPPSGRGREGVLGCVCAGRPLHASACRCVCAVCACMCGCECVCWHVDRLAGCGVHMCGRGASSQLCRMGSGQIAGMASRRTPANASLYDHHHTHASVRLALLVQGDFQESFDLVHKALGAYAEHTESHELLKQLKGHFTML